MSAFALSSVPASKRLAVESTGQCFLSRTIGTNLFGHCIGYLTAEELAGTCLVSRSWQSFIDGPSGQLLWKNLSIREGVPVVEGKDRNYKEEFIFLRPITISGSTIAQYLGKIVGELPLMREDCFFKLRHSQDDFESARLVREIHTVVIDPAALKIKVGPDRPLALDESGNLVEVPDAKRKRVAPEELIVPFSFENLRTLTKYPLAGMKNCPVFEQRSLAEVFHRYTACPDQNGIFIMRREGVAQGKPFNGQHGQNAEVTRRGWEVMTVRQRALFDAIEILKTGTCPDLHTPETYVRSAESVHRSRYDANASIGDFAPGIGIHVCYCIDSTNPTVGVVPGLSAEVRSPLDAE